ncbi:SKP1-like protein 1A [Musa acuminata AAA Group]|uniref:SKP1-like protein 1A n=1 Tax=Musa acuminata AAA Group TaxID=214697 RepID=UPI0031E46100
MASGDNGRKIVKLRSSDGILFEVDEGVARQYSQSIGNLIEDDCTTGVIPIYNVTGRILRMLLEYMENHANATNNGVFGGPDPVLAQRLKKRDAEFINVDNDTLFDLLEAADYFNVSSPLELTVKTIAGKMKGKTPEEILDTFDIVCDYTPEEEQEVRRQYFWAFH